MCVAESQNIHRKYKHEFVDTDSYGDLSCFVPLIQTKLWCLWFSFRLKKKKKHVR